MPEINPQELKVAENRRRFTEIYRSTVTREGADRLFAYLESTDFFSAPASTRYHGNYEGGLCQHSLNVYDCLCDILARPRMQEVYGIRYSDESIAIAALLHDLCKVNFYKTSFRNAKNEQGKWEQVPYYTIEDNLPYGHGEKSVYIISAYMRLTRDEASPPTMTPATWARRWRCSRWRMRCAPRIWRRRTSARDRRKSKGEPYGTNAGKF